MSGQRGASSSNVAQPAPAVEARKSYRLGSSIVVVIALKSGGRQALVEGWSNKTRSFVRATVDTSRLQSCESSALAGEASIPTGDGPSDD